MGIAYPQYFMNPEQLALINQIVEKIKADNFTIEQLKRITHRPLRAEELNTSLTLNTRVYKTILDNGTITGLWHKLCATDTAAAEVVVPTGSVYLIFGWICINSDTEMAPTVAEYFTIGEESVGQIKVNGVLRNELALLIAHNAPNHCILTLDQIVVATEQTNLLVQMKGKDEGECLVFPLAYRIGPKSQLDVT